MLIPDWTKFFNGQFCLMFTKISMYCLRTVKIVVVVVIIIIIIFWLAPLRVRSATCSQQSPSILSHVDCFRQCQVVKHDIVKDCFQPLIQRSFSSYPPVQSSCSDAPSFLSDGWVIPERFRDASCGGDIQIDYLYFYLVLLTKLFHGTGVFLSIAQT